MQGDDAKCGKYSYYPHSMHVSQRQLMLLSRCVTEPMLLSWAESKSTRMQFSMFVLKTALLDSIDWPSPRRNYPGILGANVCPFKQMSGSRRLFRKLSPKLSTSLVESTSSFAVSTAEADMTENKPFSCKTVDSGAAGNFLAPISGLSENAFKTVIEIDTVSGRERMSWHICLMVF